MDKQKRRRNKTQMKLTTFGAVEIGQRIVFEADNPKATIYTKAEPKPIKSRIGKTRISEMTYLENGRRQRAFCNNQTQAVWLVDVPADRPAFDPGPQVNGRTLAKPPAGDVEAAADLIRRLIAEINERERGHYFNKFLAGSINRADLKAMNDAAKYLAKALEALNARIGKQ